MANLLRSVVRLPLRVTAPEQRTGHIHGPAVAQKSLERCESGRIGLTANELTWVTGSEGSNPSLSARRPGPWVRTLRIGLARAGAGLPCPAPAGNGLVRGVCA